MQVNRKSFYVVPLVAILIGLAIGAHIGYWTGYARARAKAAVEHADAVLEIAGAATTSTQTEFVQTVERKVDVAVIELAFWNAYPLYQYGFFESDLDASVTEALLKHRERYPSPQTGAAGEAFHYFAERLRKNEQ